METAGTTACATPSKRRLSTKASSSSSFRLRCDSLNSLRLRRIFDLFDKNNDGLITVDELSRALNLLGLDTDLSDLESTIKSFIQPGNKGLQFEDFVSLHQSLDDAYFGAEDVAEIDHKTMSQEDSDLSEAFKVFDEDGDGYISAKELQVVLGKLGFSEGNEIDRVEKMIFSVDRNQDGRVDFFEFKDMMRSVLVRSS
jgi:calcium-binding protein CML|uniref:EF-hand domain-containing protein n=1 Tax=Fagus sylvatica TaxID=28930 RepID=A0A2N9FI14_FAGSY